MAIWQWSKTPANNANADPTISFPEGQPPSTLNDSDRALMARVAEWRDDTSGMLLDTGTASAYTVTTNEGVQTPTPTDGTRVSFIPAHTNNSGVTLAVDGGTAFPIQTASGVAVPSSFMTAGDSYDVVFKASASAWLVKNFYSTSIGAGSITYSQIQNVSASRLLGNPTGGSASVSEIALGTNLAFSGSTLNGPTFFTPNIQVFTSGSSLTYTTPTNGGNRPLYLRVRMVGGGGGGGAAGTNAGSVGTDTSWDSGGWTAIHGAGGSASSGAGGAGGSGGVNGTGTVVTRVGGADGNSGFGVGGSLNAFGGPGGGSLFGGAGAGAQNAAGGNAKTNTGSGGAGGGNSNGNTGGGGGAGEYVEFIVTSPNASYVYTVGSGGNGGAAGIFAGGNGAAGRIEVLAHWQ